LTAESIQTQSQETARLISVRTKGISNENFLCACDRCNPDAVSDACACRYDLPVAAMSRVRRHRLHPDSGAMRDSGAIPSPQAIVAGSEAADILLLSIVPATVAIIAPATADSDAVTRSDASGRNDGWCRCTSISVYSFFFLLKKRPR